MIDMVRVGKRSPSRRITLSAMVIAAPLRSRITPMMVPSTMTMPM
ncbi:hypothetical protein ABIA46_000843 [Pseudomonas aeruginosa]